MVFPTTARGRCVRALKDRCSGREDELAMLKAGDVGEGG